MNGAGHQFLAGPTLAGHQDCHIGWSRLEGQKEHLLHGGAVAHQLAEKAMAAELALEALAPLNKLPLGDCPLQKNAKRAGADRFFDKPERTVLVDSADGGFDIAVCGHDNRGRPDRIFLAQAAQEFYSIHTRHHQVGNDSVEFELLRLTEGLRAVCRGVRGKTPTVDHARDCGPLAGLIIDD